MSSGSDPDRDLFARLNALKRSNIDLDNRTVASVPSESVPIDPSPGRALHADLLDRFKSLSGGSKQGTRDTAKSPGDNSRHVDDETDNDKTVEELLADLGPAEQWDIGTSETDQVDDLLRSANAALSSKPKLEKIPCEEDEGTKSDTKEHTLPPIDVSAFRPEPDSDDDTEAPTKIPTKNELRSGLHQEADDVLQRLLDEVKYEQKHTTAEIADDSKGGDDGDDDHDQGKNQRASASRETSSTALPPACPPPQAASKLTSEFSLPSAPTVLPTPPAATDPSESDLAARFASLSLPTATPSSTVRSSGGSTTRSKPAQQQYSDDEIDSWCIICSDDATLQCVGCDGDLYCTNCWLEGHRGEDAGMEERRHKAVQFVKGKKKKKKQQERRLVGAQ